MDGARDWQVSPRLVGEQAPRTLPGHCFCRALGACQVVVCVRGRSVVTDTSVESAAGVGNLTERIGRASTWFRFASVRGGARVAVLLTDNGAGRSRGWRRRGRRGCRERRRGWRRRTRRRRRWRRRPRRRSQGRRTADALGVAVKFVHVGQLGGAARPEESSGD